MIHLHFSNFEMHLQTQNTKKNRLSSLKEKCFIIDKTCCFLLDVRLRCRASYAGIKSDRRTEPLCLPTLKEWDVRILPAAPSALLYLDLTVLLCASPAPPGSPLPQSRRPFPRSLIGNWSCLTGSDSPCCCCALSVVMWRSVFIGNLHKNPWGNGRPSTWSSLMAQSVLGDDQRAATEHTQAEVTLEKLLLLHKCRITTQTTPL